MMETVDNSVEKMKRLLFQLRGGYSLGPPTPVALADVMRQVVAAKSGLRPAPRLEPAGGGALSVVAHGARLERVIGHLVQNAVEATPPGGDVVVRYLRQNDTAVITVSDSGCGMSEQFIRERLFKPFESGKASGMGIGSYEVWQYVRELGGRIDVESREAHGTVFRITLPLHIPPAAEANAMLEKQA
jgi:signal transduction histidine kinase